MSAEICTLHKWANKMPKRVHDPLGSIVDPLYLGITFCFEQLADVAAVFAKPGTGYAYGRMGNPTVTACEEFLADVEHADKRSVYAASSGLSALNILFAGLTSRRAGGKRRVAASAYIYGGSYHQLSMWRDDHGYDICFVEQPEDIHAWERAITDDTAFVFLETPANPIVSIYDIAQIAKVAHGKGSFLVVDNTLGVTLQHPLELGADVVLHSMTKALNRQSTGLGGALVCKGSFLSKFEDILDDYQISLGAVIHPLSAWFVLNNSHTIRRDMRNFSNNALIIAQFLETFPTQIKRVHYPLLRSSPYRELANRQMPNGAGGLLSFEMFSFEAAKTLVESLETFFLAPHLGDVRNLVIHPASTTHSKLGVEELAKANITPELVRLSIGIADDSLEDARRDLAHALQKIY